LALNAWTHVALVYDGSTLRLSRNGAQSASQTASGTPIATSGNLQLAASQFGEHLAGQFDDVRLYDRALSAAEVQGLFTLTAPAF
jgi:hypothetical protein